MKKQDMNEEHDSISEAIHSIRRNRFFGSSSIQDSDAALRNPAWPSYLYTTVKLNN